MNRLTSNIAVNSRTQRIIDLAKDKIDDSNITNYAENIAGANNMVAGNEKIIIEWVDEIIVPSEDVLTAIIPSVENLNYDTLNCVTNNYLSVGNNEVLTQVPFVIQLTNEEVISDVSHQEKSNINNISLPNISHSTLPNCESTLNDDSRSFMDLDDSLLYKEQYISYNETSGPNDSDYVPSLLESSDDEEPLKKRQCNHNNVSQNNHQENISGNTAEEITDNNNTMTTSIAKIKFKRKVMKERKDKGEEYITRKGILKKKKEMVYIDNCCRKGCVKNIPKCDQLKIFKDFWALGEQKLSDQVLSDRISIVKKKCERKGRGKSENIKNRDITVIFLLEIKNEKITVCKRLFQEIHGVSKAKVDMIIIKKKTCGTGIIDADGRGNHEPWNKNAEEQSEILKHIESFPKYQSHYSRRHTNKKYLSGQLNVAKLHSLYEEQRREQNCKPVSYNTYVKTFNSTGYKFKVPSIDTCQKCDTFMIKEKAAAEEDKPKIIQEKNIHLQLAQSAYDSKSFDKKETAKCKDTRVLVFDLQQCLPTPSLNSNIVYYKRQLWTFNFTVRDTTTGDTSCYMWHEGVAGRGSDEIASCLTHKLLNLPEEITKVIAYSDSCPGQNKNINVAAAFSYFVSTSKLQIVDHKFMEPGHTRMECDVDHARIERAKKCANIEIKIPQDWYQFVRTVRGKKQFQVVEMKQENFIAFSELFSSHLVKRTKTDQGEPINWLKIKWLRYTKMFGIILFKNSLKEEEDFKVMDFRRKKGRPVMNIMLNKCFDGPVPIDSKKKKDLLSLLPLLDPVYHSFYKDFKTRHSPTEVGDGAESSDSED